MRKIHIDNKIWEYKIGRRFFTVRSPITNKRISVEYPLYTTIRPSDIKLYIVEHLIG